MDFLTDTFTSVMCWNFSASANSNKFVAAQMGRQVIHWEKEGVMDIFREPSEDAAVEKLKKLIKCKPSLIDPTHPSRDNAGAAMLHWAVIHRGVFQNKSAAAVVEYLLNHHEKNVINVYYKELHRSYGLFDGESALHLAVAFGDTKLIKRLIQANADPASRAYGTFFEPSGTCYFGEYPLSFAVACGGLEVAEILVAGGRGAKLLRNCDSFGNTALHIAAVHRRTALFDWLLVKLETTLSIDRMTVLNELGASGLTPLGLAAVLAHVDNGAMFDFVLSRMSRVEWVFGRVSCTSVPLDQLDSIPLHPSNPQHISILSMVLCKRIYPLATHPHLVGIMDAKWEQFGRQAFLAAFILHVGRLFVISYLAIEYRYLIDDLNEAKKTGASIDTTQIMLLEWIIFADSLLQCILVLVDCYAGFSEYRSQMKIIEKTKPKKLRTMPPWLAKQPDGAEVWEKMINRDNFMAMATANVTSWLDTHVPLSEYDFFAWVGQVLTIIHLVLMVENDENPDSTITGFLSIGLLFIWISTLKFTAFSRELGMLTTIIFRTVRTDVTSFLVVFSIFLVGFGTALHVLEKAPNTYSNSLDKLVKTALGDTATFPGWSKTAESNTSWLAYFLNLWFAICALVILLNLLISIFSCTFSSVRDVSEREWRLSKGRATLLIERRLKLLMPCLTDRMRVNHFAGFASDEAGAKHRYVFMTEKEDSVEDDRIEVAVKKAFTELVDEEKKPPQEQELEEVTFREMGDMDQPQEIILEDAMNTDGIEVGFNDTPKGSEGGVSLKNSGVGPLLSTMGNTVHTNNNNNNNPLASMPQHSVDLSSLTKPLPQALEGDGMQSCYTTPEKHPIDLLAEKCFDSVQGEGTWTRFTVWMVNEFGSLNVLDQLNEEDLSNVIAHFFPSSVTPQQRQQCVTALTYWTGQ
eukprot:TRINITY_DN2992_c0_g2_i2.p1 TRINITY_DN2992_c0_g2~~TRINITY_DN2992_c0_g2_i2.p1  ORF type:complete len:917 (+),score=177.61 TRINITY_DN2992_c0_g2_i2:57-2807(+)